MSTDLFLTRRAFDRTASDRQGVDLDKERGDIKVVSGQACLAQAIINRLLTRRGELTDLGHPDYGSRLYQLIGEPISRRTQAVAELYIREALAEESRIKEIVAITFAQPSLRLERRHLIEATIVIRPMDSSEALAITTQIPL